MVGGFVGNGSRGRFDDGKEHLLRVGCGCLRSLVILDYDGCSRAFPRNKASGFRTIFSHDAIKLFNNMALVDAFLVGKMG